MPFKYDIKSLPLITHQIRKSCGLWSKLFTNEWKLLATGLRKSRSRQAKTGRFSAEGRISFCNSDFPG